MIRTPSPGNRAIRVLLAIESDSLRACYAAAIERQDDMALVGSAVNPVELLLSVRQTEADVVLIQSPRNGSLPPICTHLFAEYADLLIVGVDEGESNGRFWQQQIVQTPIRTESSNALLDAIRRRVEVEALSPQDSWF